MKDYFEVMVDEDGDGVVEEGEEECMERVKRQMGVNVDFLIGCIDEIYDALCDGSERVACGWVERARAAVDMAKRVRGKGV